MVCVPNCFNFITIFNHTLIFFLSLMKTILKVLIEKVNTAISQIYILDQF